MTIVLQWLPLTVLLIDVVIKIVALGTIPRNRRPSSSLAWLLLITVTPVFGLILFLLIGSPFVRGRRERVQIQANQVILEHTADLPPTNSELPIGMGSMVRLNRRLSSLPMMTGTSHGLFGDYDASIAAMTTAVREAQRWVHVEIYIMAWDHTTDAFFGALVDAVRRGVKVRLLYDHLGSRKYPGFGQMNKRMTTAGIEWYQMMPIHPLKGRWRRPDLRNHRKLLVVDGEVGFMGSQNMIDASYLARKNIKIGRKWHDLNIKLSGQIVSSLDAVFALDWYTETGQRLPEEIIPPENYSVGEQAMQLLPSGPGYLTIPNLRLFTALVSISAPSLPHQPLLRPGRIAAGSDHHRVVSWRRGRALRLRVGRSVRRAARPVVLLRRTAKRRRPHLPLPPAHSAARQVLHRRRRRRRDRLVQHGLPLLRSGL
jgi:cardiolipin synthase